MTTSVLFRLKIDNAKLVNLSRQNFVLESEGGDLKIIDGQNSNTTQTF